MGFKAKKKLYLLRFAEGHDLCGLEVTMASVSMGVLLEMQELSSRPDETKADMAAFHRLVEVFAGAMIGWNLEDEQDQPIPANETGILLQDPDFIMAIISEWTKAISGVPDPLDEGSTSGGLSLEASLPMAPLSSSLPS